MGIEWGKEVKDSITGFQGRLVGRREFMGSGVEVLIQPKGSENDFPEPLWIPECRMIEIEPKTKAGFKR